MSKKLDVGNPGAAVTGNDGLKLFELPGTGESMRVLTDRDPHRFPDNRPKSEGTTPMLSYVSGEKAPASL